MRLPWDIKIQKDLPIKIEDEDKKKKWDGEMKNYTNRKASLKSHRGNVHSLIKGQCTQVMLDKMKYAPSWGKIMEEKSPTAPLELTQNTVYEHTSDQCPVATVYEQQQALYGF